MTRSKRVWIWTPERSGPIWEAFELYWRAAKDQNGKKAIAWRAFHAGVSATTARNAPGNTFLLARQALKDEVDKRFGV